MTRPVCRWLLAVVLSACGIGDSDPPLVVTAPPAPLDCEDVGCADAASSRPAYRVTRARLLDPHLYADPLFIGCTDVTDRAPAGKKSANEEIAISIDEDGDGDGFLDFSVLFEFSPGEGEHGAGTLRVARGLCAVANPGECQLDWRDEPVATAFEEELDDGECYSPDASVLSSAPYRSRVSDMEAPCFTGAAVDLPFQFGDTVLTLADARIVGESGKEVFEGIVVGFVTFAEARDARVKKKPLATYLPGGDDVCADHDDTDVAGGRNGWWFHFEFTAEPVEIVPAPPTELSGTGCSVAGLGRH